MAASNGGASFYAQANALLRKNLTFQKRNPSTNFRLILAPVIFFALFGFAQRKLNEAIEGIMIPAVDNPPKVPPLVQVPAPGFRAVKTDFLPFADLPNESCIKESSCPVTVLVTGKNQSLGESLTENLFSSSSPLNDLDHFSSLTNHVLGSDMDPSKIENVRDISDQALKLDNPRYIYQVQPKCNRSSNTSILEASKVLQREVVCVEALPLWRNSSDQINDELFKGYQQGNPKGEINEIMTAYDFLNSDVNNYNVSIWYNSTYSYTGESEAASFPNLRVPRSINMASNAYLQSFLGPTSKVLFEFVKEMPKGQAEIKVDVFAQLGSLFYTWIILQLFPVILTSLVYEKQQKLRIIMKMHGLGDGPYWLISYAYFLALYSIYMITFVGCGTVLGFQYFTLNDYSIQLVFYFTYVNVQISFAFLLAGFFANVKTAAVVSYILVFATGLLGLYFESCLEDPTFPRDWIIAMELYPGFALCRGLYEFRQYSSAAIMLSTTAMQWGNLSDSFSGMRETLIIMGVEWLVFLLIAFYIDQVVSAGGGVRRSPLFFLQRFRKNPESPLRTPGSQGQGPLVSIETEKVDVAREREKVEKLVREPSTNYAIVSDNLKKAYPGRDGNPEKIAVKGLSLALPKGECFGMLGPNGAGKTSFISMMIGLTEPSSGAAYVQGLDIRTQMNEIYTSMGVCPQHDLLWETLTAREHLLFYGRLKNLSGTTLTQAVEESLKGVNLLRGGVADKPAGKYSGGMKRRLSVAISLIGDPKVVYMDEPSTGLDPASRNMLWNAVTRAKEGRAIILTTHSMEEAEHLCDRLGIFVDGSLQCIGRTNELKGRYGGSYVLTMTTSSDNDAEVEDLVRQLSPNALRTYHIPGTQKFELPKNEVNIADVFEAVEDAKKRFTVQAWGLADTTLEDVFIKVARDAEAFKVLS